VSVANIFFGPIIDEIGMTPVLLFGGVVSLLLAWYADLRPRTEREAAAAQVAFAD
jgi:hypothetical protein